MQRMILLINLQLVMSYCYTIISFCPKLSISIFILKFTCLSNIINVDLLFKYSINSDTAYFGGIDIKICIWSGHASASSNSTPGFLSHKFPSILPISALNLLYYHSSILLYSYNMVFTNITCI